MINIPKILSYAALLAVSSVLGVLGKAPEMALSIVAGAIGLAFTNIDKIAKFKGAGFEAEMRNQLTAIIEKETEIEPEEKEQVFVRQPDQLDKPEKSVVTALSNPSYTWRSIRGICEETSLADRIVVLAIADLSKRGLVVSSGTGRYVKWALTANGRQLAHALVHREKEA